MQAKKQAAAQKSLAAFDRPMPHDIASERELVACALTDVRVLDALEHVRAEHFYNSRYAKLWETLRELHAEGLDPDLNLVRQRLNGSDDVLKEVLSMASGLTSMADTYATVVLECWQRRELIATCYSAICRAQQRDEEIGEVERALMDAISKISINRSQLLPIRIAADEALSDIDRMLASDRHLVGMTTGFADLDYFTTGFNPPDVWIIAGRPSTGKTSFLVNLVENVVTKEHVPVGVFSLESSMKSLVKRMLARGSVLNLRHVRTLTDEQKHRLVAAHIRLRKQPIWYDDRGGLSTAEIRAQARRMAREGCRIIFIDYLQLAHAEAKHESRYESVADVSNAMKHIAKELNVVMVVLSQLSRRAEQQSRDPMLSDLAESDAIGRDADVVIFLKDNLDLKDVPEDYAKLLKPEDLDKLVRLTIAKQREGPQAELFLLFDRPHMRFMDIAWKHH